MAIKGKGKTKSRPPARAPRPAPVVRKPPFFARRWVQVAIALVAGAGLVVVVVWATNGLRATDAEDAAAAKESSVRRVLQQWQTTVDGALASVAPSTASGAPVVVLPSLTASVDTLSSGKASDKDVTTAQDTADTAVKLIDEAVATLEGVDVPGLIRDQGLDTTAANYVLNSRTRMVEGLDLYGRVAAMVKAATAEGADPAVSQALVAEAAKLVPIAKQVFDEGHTDYTSALASAGLLQPTGGMSPGGLSPGGLPPGGLSPGGLSPGGAQPGVPST